MFGLISSISTSQGRSLWTTLCATLVITPLIWLGLPTAACLWSDSSYVQASASKRHTTQGRQESKSLEPGKPIEQELSGGQSHSYRITMTSGQYLRIAVSQRGIDVSVALFTPDGKKIGEADGEQATEGAETISVIAEATGAYSIEVRSTEITAGTGRYEILIGTLRKADAEDKYRVAAESIFREATAISALVPERERLQALDFEAAFILQGEWKGEWK